MLHKSQNLTDVNEEVSFHSIKGFAGIQFIRHVARHPFLLFQGEDNFMHDDDVVRDITDYNKIALDKRDNLSRKCLLLLARILVNIL